MTATVRKPRIETGVNREGLLVGGISYRLAESSSQFGSPGGSSDVRVRLESKSRHRRSDVITEEDSRAVDLFIDISGGPSGHGGAVTVSMWPGDLPVLISCLIYAAWHAVRDDVVGDLVPEGRDLINALFAVLPKEKLPKERRRQG